MKRIILTILATSSMILGNAQVFNCTLDQCIKLGLENNFSLRITRNEEQIAHNNATLANAGYLPELGLSAGYNGDLGSTSATVRATGAKETTRNNFDNMLTAGVNLSWTIFDGFNTSTTYKQLKEMERMGETETRIAVENFIAEIASEYYNFIQQRRRLENYRNAVKLSKERLRIVEERYNIGSFSRLDYQQAKVDFNADSAQFLKQQETVIASRITLNELMAIKQVYTPIETKETGIDIDSTLNFERLWYDTFDKNASLLFAEQNKNISNFDYKKAMSRFYPSLKLKAGYDYAFNHYSNSNYTLRHGWGGNVGVTIGFKLWDGNERREKRNAKIRIQNAELQRDQIELAIKAELGNIWHAYQNNLQLVRLEKHNVITARENHEIAKERYMLGDLSGIEMREAQQSLLEAEERLLSVEFNTKICEISLMLISGNISRYLK